MIVSIFGTLTEELCIRLVLGTIICTVLAYAGNRKATLNRSGAVAAWIFGMAIILLCGLPWLILILVFFILAALATKYKYKSKQKIGVAEERLGARSWENVMANGMAPLLFVISEFIYPGAIFLVGYLGAVSTTLADTLSSEIGLTSRSDPWLITSFKRVKPGTHGGVSLLGTITSLLGCLVLGILAWFLQMETRGDWRILTVVLFCVVGGMVGGTVDSILGAVFERKGRMSNSQVNLISSLAGGLAAIALFLAI